MCCTIRDLEPPAFVNGAVHWVVFQSTNSNDHIEKSPTFILAFDLEEEVFREILQPELPFYNRQIAIGLRLRASVSVLVYGNSIALFHYVYQRGHFHIWVMKEYGVESSWTKVFSFSKTNATETIPRPIGFRRNREIVF